MITSPQIIKWMKSEQEQIMFTSVLGRLSRFMIQTLRLWKIVYNYSNEHLCGKFLLCWRKRAVGNLKAKRRPGKGNTTHRIIGYENISYKETCQTLPKTRGHRYTCGHGEQTRVTPIHMMNRISHEVSRRHGFFILPQDSLALWWPDAQLGKIQGNSMTRISRSPCLMTLH